MNGGGMDASGSEALLSVADLEIEGGGRATDKALISQLCILSPQGQEFGPLCAFFRAAVDNFGGNVIHFVFSFIVLAHVFNLQF